MSVQTIDKGWERIKRELKLADGSFVKVGFPQEKETQHKGGGVNVASLAIIHELGTSTIPARPFMSESFEKNREEINRFKEKEQNSIYEGKQTTAGALAKLGSFFKSKIIGTIRGGGFVPLNPKTIFSKGSSVPLIDTAQMVNSVDYEVHLK